MHENYEWMQYREKEFNNTMMLIGSFIIKITTFFNPMTWSNEVRFLVLCVTALALWADRDPTQRIMTIVKRNEGEELKEEQKGKDKKMSNRGMIKDIHQCNLNLMAPLAVIICLAVIWIVICVSLIPERQLNTEVDIKSILAEIKQAKQSMVQRFEEIQADQTDRLMAIEDRFMSFRTDVFATANQTRVLGRQIDDVKQLLIGCQHTSKEEDDVIIGDPYFNWNEFATKDHQTGIQKEQEKLKMFERVFEGRANEQIKPKSDSTSIESRDTESLNDKTLKIMRDVMLQLLLTK